MIFESKPTMLAALAGLAMQAGSVLADPVVEVRQTTDYLALSFEAEDYTSADERWVLTNPVTPAIDPAADPDPNHSDLAVGNAYLELLPDYRVTEHDPFIGPNGEQGLWNTAGTGPQLTYSINFPQAGRYYVHARALSTGKEDNGMHVGINGEWPDSGWRHQFCTAGQGWKWSSRQRDSGGEDNPCGIDHTIWITVPSPGVHTFNISAREDGFELDRVMLIKDLSDNTRVCWAHGENSISCRDDSLEHADEVADVQVEISSSAQSIDYVDTVNVRIDVENLDAVDSASGVSLILDVDLGTDWDLVSVADASCSLIGEGEAADIACDIGTLPTSPPDDTAVLQFMLAPLRSGALTIDATVNADSTDDVPGNNSDSVQIVVSETGRLSRLDARMLSEDNTWTVDQAHTVTVQVQNLGAGIASDVSIEFMLAEGLEAFNIPLGCIGITTIICSLGELSVGQTEERSMQLQATVAGLYSISAMASAENIDGEAPRQSFIATVFDERSGEAPVETVATDVISRKSSTGVLAIPAVLLLISLLLLRASRTVRVPD